MTNPLKTIKTITSVNDGDSPSKTLKTLNESQVCEKKQAFDLYQKNHLSSGHPPIYHSFLPGKKLTRIQDLKLQIGYQDSGGSGKKGSTASSNGANVGVYSSSTQQSSDHQILIPQSFNTENQYKDRISQYLGIQKNLKENYGELPVKSADNSLSSRKEQNVSQLKGKPNSASQSPYSNSFIQVSFSSAQNWTTKPFQFSQKNVKQNRANSVFYDTQNQASRSFRENHFVVNSVTDETFRQYHQNTHPSPQNMSQTQHILLPNNQDPSNIENSNKPQSFQTPIDQQDSLENQFGDILMVQNIQAGTIKPYSDNHSQNIEQNIDIRNYSNMREFLFKGSRVDQTNLENQDKDSIHDIQLKNQISLGGTGGSKNLLNHVSREEFDGLRIKESSEQHLVTPYDGNLSEEKQSGFILQREIFVKRLESPTRDRTSTSYSLKRDQNNQYYQRLSTAGAIKDHQNNLHREENRSFESSQSQNIREIAHTCDIIQKNPQIINESQNKVDSFNSYREQPNLLNNNSNNKYSNQAIQTAMQGIPMNFSPRREVFGFQKVSAGEIQKNLNSHPITPNDQQMQSIKRNRASSMEQTSYLMDVLIKRSFVLASGKRSSKDRDSQQKSTITTTKHVVINDYDPSQQLIRKNQKNNKTPNMNALYFRTAAKKSTNNQNSVRQSLSRGNQNEPLGVNFNNLRNPTWAAQISKDDQILTVESINSKFLPTTRNSVALSFRQSENEQFNNNYVKTSQDFYDKRLFDKSQGSTTNSSRSQNTLSNQQERFAQTNNSFGCGPLYPRKDKSGVYRSPSPIAAMAHNHAQQYHIEGISAGNGICVSSRMKIHTEKAIGEQLNLLNHTFNTQQFQYLNPKSFEYLQQNDIDIKEDGNEDIENLHQYYDEQYESKFNWEGKSSNLINQSANPSSHTTPISNFIDAKRQYTPFNTVNTGVYGNNSMIINKYIKNNISIPRNKHLNGISNTEVSHDKGLNNQSRNNDNIQSFEDLKAWDINQQDEFDKY